MSAARERLLADTVLLASIQQHRSIPEDGVRRVPEVVASGRPSHPLRFLCHDAAGGLVAFEDVNVDGTASRKSDVPRGMRRALWPRPPAYPPGERVVLCEGAKDAFRLLAAGVPAVAVPGAGGASALQRELEAFAGLRVLLVPHCDTAGRRLAGEAAALLAPVAREVRLVDLAEQFPSAAKRPGYDLTDHLMGGSAADVREQLDMAWASAQPHWPPVEAPPAAPAGARPRLRVLDMDWMLSTEPPPVPWVVEPLLVKGGVTMIGGREGQGKSLLAQALAAAIGHGADLAGMQCGRGRVMYVDAENGPHEAHRRVRKLGVCRGALVYVDAEGFRLQTHMQDIVALLDEHRPDVLVLDSLKSLSPGADENDSDAMESVLRPLSKLAQGRGVAILIVHHAGKQGVEYRGSTAIGAVVELGFSLTRNDDDPRAQTRRKLTCWKSRPAREPAARWLEIEDAGDRVTVTETDPYEGRAGEVRSQLAEDLRGVLTVEGQSRADLARRVGRDPKDGSVRRALEQLEAERVAERLPGGPWRLAVPGLAA